VTLRLTIERERMGLSKAKLSRKADLDQSSVSKIEAGLIKPYPKQLERLANALDLPNHKADLLLQDAESSEKLTTK